MSLDLPHVRVKTGDQRFQAALYFSFIAGKAEQA
jgi:hypothetical protein